MQIPLSVVEYECVVIALELARYFSRISSRIPRAGPRRGKTRGMRGRKSREERSPHNRVISSLGTQVNSDTRVSLVGKIAEWLSESHLDREIFLLIKWKYARLWKKFSNLRFLVFENYVNCVLIRNVYSRGLILDYIFTYFCV